MRPISVLRTLSFLALLGPAQLLAQDLSEDARSALLDRVAAYETAMLGDDPLASLDFMSPGVLGARAAVSGQTPEELRASTVPGDPAGFTLDSFDLDEDAIELRTTPDGGRTYAVLPLLSEWTDNGQRGRAANNVLALEEDGTWYFVHLYDAGAVTFLGEAYPEFGQLEVEPYVEEPIP